MMVNAYDTRRIYITHCSKKKDSSLKGTRVRVPPIKMYTSSATRLFMQTCDARGVEWAILSDQYGVWFPDVCEQWYEKDPSSVSVYELRELVRDFDERLREYDEIWFYYKNEHRLHRLYRELLNQSRLKMRVTEFNHIGRIVLSYSHHSSSS